MANCSSGLGTIPARSRAASNIIETKIYFHSIQPLMFSKHFFSIHSRTAKSTGGKSSLPANFPSETAGAAMAMELMLTFDRRRLHREVTLALRSGIRDVTADFSFIRTKGLRNLLKSLRSIANSEDAIRYFRYSQTLVELQVVPVLFNNSLMQLQDDPIVKLDYIFGAETVKIRSPATDAEVALALRVLEGCCLLHRGSAALAYQHKAVKAYLTYVEEPDQVIERDNRRLRKRAIPMVKVQ